MERDPVLFAWRTTPRRHAVAAGLAAGLGGALALFALLCLRDLVGLLGLGDGGTATFLSVTLPLPGADGSRPLPILPGWRLDAASLSLAALLGLAASALIAAALGWIVGRLCFGGQAAAAQRLRAAATEAILRSPSGAREDLRTLPRLVGEVLAGIGPITAGGIVVPAMTLAATVLALLLAGLAAPRLVPAAALGLLALGLARLLVLRRNRRRVQLRRREREAVQDGLADLIARMPAVRTHGAASFEKRRLGLRALSARGVLARAEAGLAYARAPLVALVVLMPAILVATALWRDEAEPLRIERVEPGALVAAAAAFALAASLIAQVLRLWFVREDLAPSFRPLAQTIDALRTPPPSGRRVAAFPSAGGFALRGAGGYDPASGERVVGIDLDLPMPAHVAIVGARGGGGRALAALLAGQIEASAGSARYGGVELRQLDGTERAHRIAFAGGEAILIDGTLRQNLLYGARSDDREALDPGKRIAVVKLAGLDALVYARGLEGRIDPRADPALAATIVAARRAIRSALDAKGLAHLVEPFDPDRYNHQATVGENILFGEARSPAFSQARLAAHPYLRAVLEAEDLTQAFLGIGLQVARSTVEIFSDLPDDHPLFGTFSLFPARERGFFEDLVARQPEAKGWRRGLAGQRDRERLIGLALRYSETRHRFGLIDDIFEARIVDARRSFAALLPPRFRDKVEFFAPDRLTAASSLEENVLFGRITQGEAGAETRVRSVMRRVLAREGLEPTVYRLGLASRVEAEPAGGTARRNALGAIGPRERAAIELVRCLVRRPDILVVGLPIEARPPDRFKEQVASLRTAREGRGLILCLPDDVALDALDSFDAVLTVERNTLVPTVAAARAVAPA